MWPVNDMWLTGRDSGRQWSICCGNGVRLCLSSFYHPASNSEVERTGQAFKEANK